MMKFLLLLFTQILCLILLSNASLTDMFEYNSVESDYHGQRVSQKHPVRNAGIADDPNNLHYVGARANGQGVFDDRSRIRAMARAHSRQVGGLAGGGAGLRGANGRLIGRAGMTDDEFTNAMANGGGGRGRMDMNSMGGMRGGGRMRGNGNRDNGLISRMQNAVGERVMKRRKNKNNMNNMNDNNIDLDSNLELNEENNLAYQEKLRNYLQQKNRMRGGVGVGAARSQRGMNNIMANVRNGRNYNEYENNYAKSQSELAGVGVGDDNNNNDIFNDVLTGQINDGVNKVHDMRDEFNKRLERTKVNGKYYVNPAQMKSAKLAAKQYKDIKKSEEENGVPNFSYSKYHGVGGMRATHLRSKDELDHRAKAAKMLKEMVDDKSDNDSQNENENENNDE